MKKTMLKKMIVSLLTVSMCMMSALSSLAATPEEIEKSRITNLLPASEAPRSLTVTVSVPAESQSSGETTQKIEGAEISIYKIADMNLEGEFAQYIPSAGFEEADASAGLDAEAFDGMTAAESQTASKLLANEIRTRGLTPTAGPVTTGADGSAVFSDLEDGVYLIMQTGSEAGSKASLYEYFDPQMALVPGFGLNDDGSLNGGDPIYNVMAFLKTELISKPYNVAIEKVDENGDALKGATLQLFDTSGTAVGDKWVTDGNPHAMKLTPGTAYVLKELAAPAGYQKAQDVTFTCDADGSKKDVQMVTMVDKKAVITQTPKATPTVTPRKPAPKPIRTVAARVVKAVKTGDYRTLLPYILAILVSAGVIVVLVRKRRKS